MGSLRCMGVLIRSKEGCGKEARSTWPLGSALRRDVQPGLCHRDKIPFMANEHIKTQPGPDTKPVIHRVCIQCNNMFRVTPENFDAKQCPNCHKG